jgi:hypothetical protein
MVQPLGPRVTPTAAASFSTPAWREALVEGDILGRGAHHSPWATAPGSGKPRPAAGLPGRGGGRDSSTYVEGGGGAEEGGIHGQSCVGLAWVLEEAAAADESWMEEEEYVGHFRWG